MSTFGERGEPGLTYTIPGGQQVEFTPYRIGGRNGAAAVVTGNGSLESQNFDTGTAGWQILGSGDVEFNDGTFRGTLEAATITGGSIDIVGATAAQSFHVDSDGDMWMGAATAGVAPFTVSRFGDVYANSIIVENMDSRDMEMLGSSNIATLSDLQSANYMVGTTGWKIDGDGNAEFESGEFRGSIVGATIDIGGDDPTSFHVDDTGFMWMGSDEAGKATAPFRVTAGGALTATGVTVTGTIRTAASDERIEIGTDFNNFIDLYTGDGDELNHGYINVDIDNTGASDFAFINLVAPAMTAGARSYIDVRHFDNGDRVTTIFGTEVGVDAPVFGVTDGYITLTDAGSTAFAGKFYGVNGSLSNPTFSFNSDTNTGMYRVGAGNLGFAAGGQLFMNSNTTQTNFSKRLYALALSTSGTAGTALHINTGTDEIFEHTSTGRFKMNQRSLEVQLAEQVLKLRPTQFDPQVVTADGVVTAQHHDEIGLIAEDVAIDFPDACIYNADGEPWNIKWNSVTTSLVLLVQQLTDRLERLEATT